MKTGYFFTEGKKIMDNKAHKIETLTDEELGQIVGGEWKNLAFILVVLLK